MGITAFTGPVISFGNDQQAADYNPEEGPSAFYDGVTLLDPRAYYTYKPGVAQDNNAKPVMGWPLTGAVVDQVPSALAAANIAALQVPTAGTALTLVSTSGAGITVAASVTNPNTGLAVTGLLAIDTAMSAYIYNSGPLAVWDPTKAVARNIRITSVGNDSAATFKLAGYDLYGYPMTETVTGANAGVASGTKAFKYLASVTPEGTLSGSDVSVGTGDVYGFPLRADELAQTQIFWDNAMITANTGFTAADTTSPATALTGDVRGTYAVQSASDGTKKLTVYVRPSAANIATTTGLLGVTQA